MFFKSYALIVDEHYPDATLLAQIAEKRLQRLSYNGFNYKYDIRFQEERFLLIAVDFNDGKYSEMVYDIESEIEKQNPRKRHELEYADQFFACYDLNEKELYLSNIQRKAAIRLLFMEHVGEKQKVRIRERLSSVEEFAEVVHSIKRVKYTQTRNLVNMDPTGLFAQGYNPLGLEIPDRLISTLEYDCGINAKAVVEKLKNLLIKSKTKEIESIEILGEDDEGFEQLFSLEKIIKSFSIDIESDGDGRYDEGEVFRLLLTQLRRK